MNEIKDRKKQTWKYSELKKLKEMVADGIDTSTIAQLLGRTTPSITSKLWYLNHPEQKEIYKTNRKNTDVSKRRVRFTTQKYLLEREIELRVCRDIINLIIEGGK